MAEGSAVGRQDEGPETTPSPRGVKLAALRQQRLHRGLTQAELAKEAGVTQDYLSRIERGRRGCNPLIAQRLAEVLGVDLRELTAEHAVATNALPEGLSPRPAGSGVTSRYLHRAYLKYVLAKEVGTAYSALSPEELEGYCRGLSWEGVLEMLRSKKRELEFLEGELEDPRVPMEVRKFFEELLREARDWDIQVLAGARGREGSDEGRERLTRAIRERL